MKKLTIAALIASGALLATPAWSEDLPVYLCVEKDGVKSLTDSPKPGCKLLTVPKTESEPRPEKRKRYNGERAIAFAKERVSEGLTDPESARFRRVVFSRDKSFVCGQVNSKNLMGGYAGYQWFTVRVVESSVHSVGLVENDNRCL